MALSGKYSGFMLPGTKTQQDEIILQMITYIVFFIYYFTCFLEEITFLYLLFTHVSGDIGFSTV